MVPRGTSIVGLDLRKTKVKPKYVPNPLDDLLLDLHSLESQVLVTSGSSQYLMVMSLELYLRTVLILVANRSKPTFSHHKLTCFEYADGVNIDNVLI